MNDINGGGAEDFLLWAVPAENAVLDAVENSAVLPKELLPSRISAGTTPTELMDTDPASFKESDDYLRDLERIKVLTLAHRPTLLWLRRALTDFPAERPISVLDVGSRGGGMLRQLRKWARGKNRKSPLLRSAKGDRFPLINRRLGPMAPLCNLRWSYRSRKRPN